MIKKLALGIVSLGLMAGAALAATPGTDNAADSAYSGGWTNGTNGGTGFGAWSLTTSGTAGFFIGDSTTLAPSNTGGDINSSGQSFGMYGHDTGTDRSDATRAFDSALTAGQTFSLDIAVNFRNGNKGFDLLDGATTIFNLNIGGDTYAVNNATTGNGDLFGDAYDSNTVFHLELDQTSLAGGTWTVTRSGGLTGTASGTYSGDASGFHLYEIGTDGGSEDNLYANNLSIVPEPATLSFLLTGSSLLGAFVFVRRRRA